MPPSSSVSLGFASSCIIQSEAPCADRLYGHFGKVLCLWWIIPFPRWRRFSKEEGCNPVHQLRRNRLFWRKCTCLSRHCDRTYCRQGSPLSDPTPKLTNIYLYFAVGGDRNHMGSFRMDREWIDRGMMSLVVLDNLFCSQIEHADSFVIRTGEHTLISWVETCASDWPLKTVIFLHLFSLLYIPNQQFLVLTSRTNQRHVLIDLSTIDPVVMPQKWPLKFLSIDVPHLHALIVACRKNGFAVIEETHRFDSPCVSLDDFGFRVSSRIPKSNGVIVRCTGDDVLIGREGNTGNLFCMSVES